MVRLLLRSAALYLLQNHLLFFNIHLLAIYPAAIDVECKLRLAREDFDVCTCQCLVEDYDVFDGGDL